MAEDHDMHVDKTTEYKRLHSQEENLWRQWGPYLSNRQWGTMREDYTTDCRPWSGFSYEQARSHAYRWGEDGILGISDDRQRLCFALALWNGKGDHIKERFFGLPGLFGNDQGNHGEDVKDYYFYLDNTPTHSYMKALYKYPHGEFPYTTLIEKRGDFCSARPEYELIDTEIFDDSKYFNLLGSESPQLAA
jgi:hypothetical protein